MESNNDKDPFISSLIKSLDMINFKPEISNDDTEKQNNQISPDTERSREHKLKRRSSINFGSPLPSPKSCAERFYDIKFPLGLYVKRI